MCEVLIAQIILQRPIAEQASALDGSAERSAGRPAPWLAASARGGMLYRRVYTWCRLWRALPARRDREVLAAALGTPGWSALRRQGEWVSHVEIRRIWLDHDLAVLSGEEATQPLGRGRQRLTLDILPGEQLNGALLLLPDAHH